MTYTGEVSVGGETDVRELRDLTISKLAVGPMSNNVYLLRCHETGEQLLIDAAYDDQRILELVGNAGLATIVTTHRHADHVQALEDVAIATGARTAAGEHDADALPLAPDRRLSDGDTVGVGTRTLAVIHLVGHTPGSIALRYDDPDGHPHVFTGDSLFPGGVGNTGSPQDFASLIDDVETKLFADLPDDTWVYPGHGDDLPGLGIERPNLAAWRERGW
ncbi:MAG: MBL fold metallo-hydrolase [Nocardioidaceae bacterium]|nr:MBL fold metallo-hydrolase [Nocardioidaceae bacterium]